MDERGKKMKRCSSVLYGVLVVLMVILYLASSTSLILKEKQRPIYHVSIILNEASEEVFQDVKKGMRQVEKEWLVETNIMTLDGQKDTKEQINMIENEISYGAQAIIIYAVNEVALQQALKDLKVNVPILCIGNSSKSMGDVYIRYDEGLRSEKIGEQCIEDEVDKVYVFSRAINDEHYRETLKDLEKKLRHNNISLGIVVYENQACLEKHYTKIAQEEGKLALVGLDEVSTQMLLQLHTAQEGKNIELYGIGYTSKLLGELDRGAIRALGVYDKYDLGYVSLSAALSLIQKKHIPTQWVIKGGIVTQEMMYEEPFEKMIFPVD